MSYGSGYQNNNFAPPPPSYMNGPPTYPNNHYNQQPPQQYPNNYYNGPPPQQPPYMNAPPTSQDPNNHYNQQPPQQYPNNYYNGPPPQQPAHFAGHQAQLQRFPPSFNFYFHMKHSYIGTSADTPCNGVRLHSGMTKNPEVVLLDGTKDSDSMLAGVKHKSKMSLSGHFTMILPAHLGDLSRTMEVELHRQSNGWKNSSSYVFSLEVGQGGNLQTEQFEWRNTRGDAAKELSGSSAGHGGKLVRLGSGGNNHDGEVVALWAWNLQGKSMTKTMKFEFQGSALAGQLGERFEIAAVVSALRLWYQQYMSKTTSNSSGANAASAAAISV
jgi:hypothetical protein